MVCRARRVSPRHPMSMPRSRPETSTTMASGVSLVPTWQRIPILASSWSTIWRATSPSPALPPVLVSVAAAVPAFPPLCSITVTSTTVSDVLSLSTLTSTLRRLSASCISAASTASSRVGPRPSAVFISSASSVSVFSGR